MAPARPSRPAACGRARGHLVLLPPRPCGWHCPLPRPAPPAGSPRWALGFCLVWAGASQRPCRYNGGRGGGQEGGPLPGAGPAALLR